MPTEPAQLDAAPARFWRRLEDGRVLCELCPRGCTLREGSRGVCKVRLVVEGELKSLVHGRISAIHLDPIEKKPLYHFFPGTKVLSVGTAGCNARCLNCQNWELAQSRPEEIAGQNLPPATLVAMAVEAQASAIAFTYTEPTIFAEYAIEVAEAAHQAGLRTIAVSNGLIEGRAAEELYGRMDAVKIDLKGFTEGFYRQVVGLRMAPVLQSIQRVAKSASWLELVTLLIPGLNDSEQEIAQLCQWVAEEVGSEVPLHFSRFHPAWQLKNVAATPIATLDLAHAIARAAGLRHVYVGNLPSHSYTKSYCPHCGTVVIDRTAQKTVATGLQNGHCSHCGRPIAGVWQ